MNKDLIIGREYDTLDQEEFSSEEWGELLLYTDFLRFFCESNEFEIEERPFIKSSNQISFAGFIGTYPFNSGRKLYLKPNPDKLSNSEFEALIQGIIIWANMYGGILINNLIKLSSPIDIKSELLLSYSILLIRSTENARLEYVPPKIEKKVYFSPVPLGKILYQQTILNFLRKDLTIVSQRIKINPESILNSLLIKFHNILAYELRNLMEEFSEINQELNTNENTIHLYRLIKKNYDYHYNFVIDNINTNELERGISFDFTNSEILQKLKKKAENAPSYIEIILLWEGFIGKKSLFPKLTDILTGGLMLKPLSKLYEIWSLIQIVKILGDLIGDYRISYDYKGNDLNLRFNFENVSKNVEVEVYFNKSAAPNKIIRDLKKLGKIGTANAGRPDIFLVFRNIETGKEISCIIEVKYRLSKTIQLADIQRFLGYIIGYSKKLSTNKIEGILLFLPSKRDDFSTFIEAENSNILIHLVKMKPMTEDIAKNYLLNHFKRIIENEITV